MFFEYLHFQLRLLRRKRAVTLHANFSLLIAPAYCTALATVTSPNALNRKYKVLRLRRI